jgi:prepilin-type N-terminal cleavage/methylation domain-containing protein
MTQCVSARRCSDEAIHKKSGLLREYARNDGCGGFTLIELLISLVIFSLVSVAALSSVNHMMRSREQQITHHDLNIALDQAYAHLFQDMTWFVGDIQVSENSLEFTRTQTSNETALTTVMYKFMDGQLFRSLPSGDTLLLKDAKNIRLSFFLKNNQWVGVFDQKSPGDNPLLLRLQFTTKHLGEVTWIFSIAHL